MEESNENTGAVRENKKALPRDERATRFVAQRVKRAAGVDLEGRNPPPPPKEIAIKNIRGWQDRLVGKRYRSFVKNNGPGKPARNINVLTGLSQADYDRLLIAGPEKAIKIKLVKDGVESAYTWIVSEARYRPGAISIIEIDAILFWPAETLLSHERDDFLDDPYFGDLEISLIWPDPGYDPNNPSSYEPDPDSVQSIVIKGVQIESSQDTSI